MNRKKKIVVIGGGSGLSEMVRGIKKLPEVELSAIVSVADDGGSTGRLRNEFNIPAVGDIRNVMLGMSEKNSLLYQIMDYRFDGDGDLQGHQLGNLVFASLLNRRKSFLSSIKLLSKALELKGRVIPSSVQALTLYAFDKNGKEIRGERKISASEEPIERVFYKKKVSACAQAVKAILEADYIIYSIGSLYTSIIPNLIIPGVTQALNKSTAKVIYFANAMTQKYETLGMNLEDHVVALLKHTNQRQIDLVIVANNQIDNEVLEKYYHDGCHRVLPQNKEHKFTIKYADLLTAEQGLIRHDSKKIYACMDAIIKEYEF